MSYRRKLEKKIKQGVTKTSHFLLPILGHPRSYYTDYLINTYITDSEQPQLIIVFDNVSNEDLDIHLYRLSNYYNFNKTYLDDEEKEKVVVIDLDNIWKNDIHKFINGDYSQFSKKLKDILVKAHGKTICSGLTKHGLPLVSMYETIYPSKEKLLSLEEALSTSKNKVTLEKREVFDSPKYEHEIYKTIKELKEMYGDK